MADADFSVKAIISAQTSQFEKGIKNAQSSVNSLSSSISNITNLVKKAFAFTGVVVGTKAIVDFGKSCVQSANQAVKTFNILDNTVRATGADAWTSIGKLENASKALSDSTNYSVTEIQKMQSVLLGFTNITGEAFDGASEAVLDMATVMGMDLTSAVQTVGKALDDPITGLDSLRRQGFKFTDEQKAELAQLVKNGKQLEAQKIILDTLAISYGGASKAGQDSFAKQRHAVENFSDTLGTKLIPLMKSFAMDNANMINSLRELIENMDFNQIGAVIKVTFDGIKKGIQNSFEYIKMIFSEINSLMKNIDFKPIVSIINNLISAFEKIGKTNLSRVINVTKDLKDSFSGFSENIDLTKFSEVINLIINGFVFLHEEANKVFDTLLDNIKTFIKNTWNSIKSIFEAGNKALSNSETDIKSWGDYFYEIFNNLFKTIQDVIQSISYLLSGDWEIAWQYAKLVVLRIVDGVIDSMTTMFTAFKDKIISILNFAQMLSPFLGTSGKVIKTALSGIEALVDGVDKNSKKIKDTMTELVENTENKIEELTGKPADKNIEDLEKFVSGSKNILGNFVDNFKEATDNAKKELNNLSGEYKATINSMKNDTESTYEAFSEWDLKLLQQRLEDLDEWSDEYHKVQLKIIKAEKQKAEKADATGAETENINKYYNKQIEKENERSEKAKRDKVIETMKVVISTFKNIASNAIQVFKKVASTIKNIFSTIGNIFTKIVEFNPDDALDNLLKFEDMILTFFVETLPKLPAFFESAIQSIVTLIGTIFNMLNFNDISKIVGNIAKSILNGITNIASLINQNSDKLTEGFTQLVSTLIKNIADWVKSGGWKELLNAILNIQKMIETVIVENMDAIVDTIVSMLPDLVETLKKSIVSASKTLGKLAPKILPLIADLINAIIEVITSDEVLDSSMEAIEGIVNGLVQAIIKLLTKAIPKLINFAIKLLSPGTMIKVTVAVVKGLIEGFKKTDWNQVVKDIFMAFIDGIKSLFGIHSPSTLFESFGVNMIEGLWNGLKEMGNWLNENVGGFFRNMWNTITSVFSNVGNWFKNAFSTVGSKITEGFGNISQWAGNIWKNIQNAFNGVGNWFKNAFSNVGSKITEGFGNVGKWAGDIWNNIKNAFSGVENWFKNTFESAGNGIKNAFNGLGKWFEDLWNNILNVMKAPINGIIDALNHVIDGFNSISVHIPDWVPFVGGKTFGINIAKIQKLAKGTDNARKGLTLVGEAGPELVNFRGGEQVLNAHNTQKALEGVGGTTINQNVTFNNLKDTTAFAMLQQLKQYNRQMAINGVL